MDKKNITKVVNFLTKYRDRGMWSIGVENGLTHILTSIELIELLDTVHSPEVIGYTKDDIAIRRKKIEK